MYNTHCILYIIALCRFDWVAKFMEFQDNPLTQGKLTVAEINFDIMKTQSVEIFVKLDFFTNDLVVLFIFVYTGSY